MKTPLWLKRLLLVLAILATAEWLYILVLKLVAAHLSPLAAYHLVFFAPIPILALATFLVLRLKPIIWMLLFAVMITPTETGAYWLMTPDGYGFPPQNTNVWQYPDNSMLYQVDLTNRDKGGNLWMLRWDNCGISNLYSPATNSQAWNVFVRTNDSGAWMMTYYCQTGWVSFNTSLNGPLGSPWSSNAVWINYDQWGIALITNWGKAVMDDQQNMTVEDTNGVPVWGNVAAGWGPLFYPAFKNGMFRLACPSPDGNIPALQGGAEEWIPLTNGDSVPSGSIGVKPQTVLLAGCAVVGIIIVVAVGGYVIKRVTENICKILHPPQNTNNPAPPDE